jgi:16S rRNA (adenine1518-N6/adenine1519-N6)-dimethyltransferase
MRDIIWHIKKYPNGRIAEILAQAFGDMVKNRPEDPASWVLIPIPISKQRFRERGYNQAELLAQSLAKTFHLKMSSKILIKAKHTAKQGTAKTKGDRTYNIIGSFEVLKKHVSFLHNKNVILIDDVTTTGSTLIEARETLLHVGAKKVIAVEKDNRLIEVLRAKFSNEIERGTFELIHGDILEFNTDTLGTSATDYKLVANIPYYITGAIIRRFLSGVAQPSRMVLLLQKEVAERIVARDGKESLLSLSVKVYGTPKYISTVKAGSFTPMPKVDSAILLIEEISKNKFAHISEETFFETVSLGFAHKRKMLAGNLKLKYESEIILSSFKKLDIDLKCRAEDLNITKWRELVESLQA